MSLKHNDEQTKNNGLQTRDQTDKTPETRGMSDVMQNKKNKRRRNLGGSASERNRGVVVVVGFLSFFLLAPLLVGPEPSFPLSER